MPSDDFLNDFSPPSSPARAEPPSPVRSSSPSTSGARKRQRTDDSDERDDDDSDVPSSPPRQSRRLELDCGDDSVGSRRAVQNRTARLTRIVQELSATRQLTESQLNEVMSFAKAPIDEMLVHVFVTAVQARDRESEKARVLAKFEVSKEQDENIRIYARAIVTNAGLKQYKSAATDNVLKNLVRLLRWDIPPEVYKNPSARTTLNSRIKFHLTQERAKLKDKIQTSIAGNDPENYQHIYTLATIVAEHSSTNRKVTTELCIRLAFLRAMLLSKNDQRYWERVDEKLTEIRSKLSNPDKYVKYFKRIYDEDRNKYGQPAEISLYPDTHPAIDTTEAHVKNAIDNSTDLGNPIEGGTAWV